MRHPAHDIVLDRATAPSTSATRRNTRFQRAIFPPPSPEPPLTDIATMPLKFIKELFGKSEITGVAEQLANELSRRYPPTMASGEGRKLSPQAVTNILESVINKAVTKSQEWDLGVVGKAKLGNNLRWALKEKGYPEKFIEMVTEALVVYLSKGPTTKPGK